MPIEIKELVIKAKIEGKKGDTPTASQSSTSSPHPVDEQALIERCVEQVLQILEDKKSR